MAIALCSWASGASAQENSLAQQANDPTASLMSFQLQDINSPNLYGTDSSLNIVQGRVAIPFTLGGLNNIARITVPGITHSPSGASGVSDVTLFDLVTFDRPCGRFGVGAVALLPTGSEGVGAGKWALGPAAGFTAKRGRFM